MIAFVPLPRRAAASLLIALFATLLISSASHDHFRHTAASAATCVFCGAALAASPKIPEALRSMVRREHDRKAPGAPALLYLLKLDHSGGAPPRAESN